MKGAKPSSGLVHLHKSFIELHFAGRALPQTVSVQACIDGRNLATMLPGQVYSTSCGQDHWLLGLQYIFKACKDPVITHVDMHGDSLVTVAISTQGMQDKYNSSDPAQRAELQRSLEAAAYKFAQTAVMRKEGRLQITGPNINIPKKQLRAQWPAILERLAPQDVQAHIFVDNPDSYIACAAKVILTKAKAEPVFYLSGLSQLLKSFMGAFVTLELLPQEQVVRLNIDTGQGQASLSTTAGVPAASEAAAETSSAAAPPASELREQQGQQATGPLQQAEADGNALLGSTKRHTDSRRAANSAPPIHSTSPGRAGRTSSAAAAASSPHSSSAGGPAPAGAAGLNLLQLPPGCGVSGLPPHVMLPRGVPSEADGEQRLLRSPLSTSCPLPDLPGKFPAGLPAEHQLLLMQQQQQAMAAAAALGKSGTSSVLRGQDGLMLLEGMASNCLMPATAGSTLAPAPQAGRPGCYTVQSDQAGPLGTVSNKGQQHGMFGRSPGHAVSPRHADAPRPAAAATAAAETASMRRKVLGAGARGTENSGPPEADGGLWLLADHAALLQATGSTGHLNAEGAVNEQVGSQALAGAGKPAVDVQQEQVGSSKRALPDQSESRRGAAATADAAAPRDHVAARDMQRAGGISDVPGASDASAGVVVGVTSWQQHPKRRRTARHVGAGATHLAVPAGGLEGTRAYDGHQQYQQHLHHEQLRYAAAFLADGGYPHQLHGGYYHPQSLLQHHVVDAATMHDSRQPHVQADRPEADLLLAAAAVTAIAGGDVRAGATDAALLVGSGGGNDDVMYLAKQQEQQPDGGEAVAVVHRVGPTPNSTVKMELESWQLTGQLGLAGAGLPPDVATVFKDQGPAHGLQRGAVGGPFMVTGRHGSSGLPQPPQQAAWQQQQQQHQQGHLMPGGLHHHTPTIAGVAGSESRHLSSLHHPSALLASMPGGAMAAQGHLEWGGSAGVGSPHSGSSSITRVLPSAIAAANCSPAAAAAVAAAMAGAGSAGIAVSHMLAPALMSGSLSGSQVDPSSAAAVEGLLGTAARAGQHWQQQATPFLSPPAQTQRQQHPALDGLHRAHSGTASPAAFRPPRQQQGDEAVDGASPGAAGAGSSSISHAAGGAESRPSDIAVHPGAVPPCGQASEVAAASCGARPGSMEECAAGTSTAAASEACRQQPLLHADSLGADAQHSQVGAAAAQAVQAAVGVPDWPVLPDADNLLVVGKSLVQVMNLLGAGSAGRLALTRSLRVMSTQDREWLVSITYPHLQDSCKRQAVDEVKMILNEIAGVDCFAVAAAQAAVEAAAAGVGPAPRPTGVL